MTDLLKKKLIPDSFNQEILDAVDVITYDQKQISFAGSFVRKSLRHSADIDIAEDFGKASSKLLSHALQTIIHKIDVHNKKNPDNKYVLLDVKSGIYPQFIGKFNNVGTIKNGKIIDYDYKITKEDLKYTDIVPPKKFKSLKEYFDFRESVRKVLTMRWSADEIKLGYKNLNGQHYPLSEAVKTFTTKLDMSFICNGFYTEISNIFIDEYTQKHALVFYPISPDVKQYDNAIKYNLMEYLAHHKYLKAVKRMFVIALFKKDKKMLNKIFPLLLSDIGLLNKANSIIKTMISLYELNKQDVKETSFQLDNLKPLISNVYQFEFGEQKIDNIIDNIRGQLKNKKATIDNLEALSEKLDEIINKNTLLYINNNNLTFPKKYLL
jgi:hypothetical protein